jgi:putative FmdB family regulatory protein
MFVDQVSKLNLETSKTLKPRAFERFSIALLKSDFFLPMPLYEYECKKCGHRFERIQKFSDAMVKKCPDCGGKVEQMISAPAVQFKGSGWYVTDYAKRSGSSSSDSGGKSESKESAESTGSKDGKENKDSKDRKDGKDKKTQTESTPKKSEKK